jgi:hypothetical protein
VVARRAMGQLPARAMGQAAATVQVVMARLRRPTTLHSATKTAVAADAAAAAHLCGAATAAAVAIGAAAARPAGEAGRAVGCFCWQRCWHM